MQKNLRNNCGQMQQRFEYYRQTYCKKLYEIHMEEEWRIPFLNELISAKNNKIVINGVDHAEIDDIINFICTT